MPAAASPSSSVFGPAADADHDPVGLDRLAVREDGPQRPARRGRLDALEAGRDDEPDAPLLELAGDEGGDLVVLAEEGPVGLLDDDDLGAEGAEDEGHLAADDPGPDDEKAGRNGVEGRQLVGGDDGLPVEGQAGQDDGPGARGDDRPGRLDDAGRAVGEADLDLARALERGRPRSACAMAFLRRSVARTPSSHIVVLWRLVEDGLVVGPGVLDDGTP